MRCTSRASTVALIADRAEVEAAGVEAARFEDRRVHLVVGHLGHPAVGVGDDHHPVDAEQVGRQHQGAQHVVE